MKKNNLNDKNNIFYPKISVIICAYNQEKNIGKCLSTIINQLYKNIEIIIVDDGSFDNTEVICRNYAKLDSRIIFIRQENRGLSAARNHGLKYVTGEYITFVDSDDYIDSDLMSNYVHYLRVYKDNILISGFRKVKNGKIVFEYKQKFILLDTKNGLEVLFKDNKKSFKNYMWNKLYPSYFFKNIYFEEDKAYEDIRIQYRLFEQSRQIIICPFIGYNYVYHTTSISNRKELILDFIDAQIDRFIYFANYDITFLPLLASILFRSYIKYCNIFYLGAELLERKKNIDKRVKIIKFDLYKNLHIFKYIIFCMCLNDSKLINFIIHILWSLNNFKRTLFEKIKSRSIE